MKKKLLMCLVACAILIVGYGFYGTGIAGNDEKTVQIAETEKVPAFGAVSDTKKVSSDFSIE